MILNLNDPASIRAWLAVWPQRHRALLRFWWKTRPEFREAIEAGVKG